MRRGYTAAGVMAALVMATLLLVQCVRPPVASAMSMLGASDAVADSAHAGEGGAADLSGGRASFGLEVEQVLGAYANITPADTGPQLTPDQKQCVHIVVSTVPYPGKKSGYTMYHAGIRPYVGHQRRPRMQTIRGAEFAKELPDGSEPGQPDCSGMRRWIYDPRYSMESARHRHTWVTLVGGNIGIPWTNGNNPLGLEPVNGLEGQAFSNYWLNWQYNQCPDGKHWLRVRATEILVAKDLQTGQVLGSRRYVWPVKVAGNCAAAARSARAAAAVKKNRKPGAARR